MIASPPTMQPAADLRRCDSATETKTRRMDEKPACLGGAGQLPDINTRIGRIVSVGELMPDLLAHIFHACSKQHNADTREMK